MKGLIFKKYYLKSFLNERKFDHLVFLTSIFNLSQYSYFVFLGIRSGIIILIKFGEMVYSFLKLGKSLLRSGLDNWLGLGDWLRPYYWTLPISDSIRYSTEGPFLIFISVFKPLCSIIEDLVFIMTGISSAKSSSSMIGSK